MRTKQISIIFMSLMILAIGGLALNHYFIHTSHNTLQENMIGEMKIFGSQIMNYYNTPRRIRGGGLHVQQDDLHILTDYIKFDNKRSGKNRKMSIYHSSVATYYLSLQDTSVKILGISYEQNIQISMLVTPSKSEPVVINLEK